MEAHYPAVAKDLSANMLADPAICFAVGAAAAECRMAREQARTSADRRRAVPAPVREPKLMTVKTFIAVVGIPLCAAWIAFAIAVGRIAAESLRTDLPAP